MVAPDEQNVGTEEGAPNTGRPTLSDFRYPSREQLEHDAAEIRADQIQQSKLTLHWLMSQPLEERLKAFPVAAKLMIEEDILRYQSALLDRDTAKAVQVRLGIIPKPPKRDLDGTDDGPAISSAAEHVSIASQAIPRFVGLLTLVMAVLVVGWDLPPLRVVALSLPGAAWIIATSFRRWVDATAAVFAFFTCFVGYIAALAARTIGLSNWPSGNGAEIAAPVLAMLVLLIIGAWKPGTAARE